MTSEWSKRSCYGSCAGRQLDTKQTEVRLFLTRWLISRVSNAWWRVSKER